MVERNQILEAQGNRCSLCNKPFLFGTDKSSPFHIDKSVVDHEHCVERNYSWGANLKEQKKAGIRGIAHGVCNTCVGLIKRKVDYDAAPVAAMMERMAHNLCNYDKQYQEGEFVLARLKRGKLGDE